MTTLQVTAPMPREAAPALPGTWKLTAGRAVTLRPREAGTLKVAHGQLWATYDGPHRGAADDSGDLVIGVGEQLRVREGQRLVVEAWNRGAPAYFSWEPLPAQARSAVPRFNAVVQPLADLRMALSMGGGAIARLVAGLLQVGWGLVAGRGGRGIGAQACGGRRAVS
jgi:hypothetical protein